MKPLRSSLRVVAAAQGAQASLGAARREPEMHPEDLQLLVTRSMPFGKHKGRLIADLPGDYLRWFVREGLLQGEIGRLLSLMHEIDHNGLSELLKPLRRP